MQITHEEAHKLIQFNADDALNAQEKFMLSAHLKDCIECRIYAEEIKEVESILLPVMKRQWHLQPIPLLADAIHVKRNSTIQMNVILATRTAAIGIVFLALIFSAWQFTLSGRQESSQLPVSILPNPTPSAQSTRTKIISRNCTEMLYIVQDGDTLESIAQRFSVSREELMTANSMKIETLNTSMQLMIPVCNSTPTGTVNPTIFSTTYTPSTSPLASTPGG